MTGDAGAAATLDFTRPVAITMLGILPFIGDDDEAKGIAGRLLAAVPAGSYLAITHSTSEVSGERVVEAVRQWNQVAPTPYHLRTPAQIGTFLRGPGADRARRGAVPALAARSARRRQRHGHGRVLRPRPQVANRVGPASAAPVTPVLLTPYTTHTDAYSADCSPMRSTYHFCNA